MKGILSSLALTMKDSNSLRTVIPHSIVKSQNCPLRTDSSGLRNKVKLLLGNIKEMTLEDMYNKLPKFIRNFRLRADPDRYWLDHFEERKEKAGHHIAGPDGKCRKLHSGYNKEDGRVYISQPYFEQWGGGLTMEKLEWLTSQCKERMNGVPRNCSKLAH